MGKNESAGNLVQTSVDVMMATLARILAAIKVMNIFGI
jgi:hypothetical protein